MQKLLSLPSNLVENSDVLQHTSAKDWFVCADPDGVKVGSGGGTAWALASNWQSKGQPFTFANYLSSDKRILIHAGGQSRRLPSYAPSGKILTPIPVFRWSRGQKLDQNLLDLQLPLYERIMHLAGSGTLVASGDVLLLAPQMPAILPKADVLCFGMWVDPHLASRHGVFFSSRQSSQELDYMLQKPSHQKIEELSGSHLFMMDVGVWVLSDKAVEVLMRKCGWTNDAFEQGIPTNYDLYSTFGASLGSNPLTADEEISSLTVAVLPLDGGEFYHYGTNLELITSTERIQNRVQDQRAIHHHRVKPHPSLFVQNAVTSIQWHEGNHHIWIENSCVPVSWRLSHHHVITGVPDNRWTLDLPDNCCLDMIPIGDDSYCIRPYGMFDRFSGEVEDLSTLWLSQPLLKWLDNRGLNCEMAGLENGCDIQKAPLFPVVKKDEISGEFISWMINEACEDLRFKDKWLTSTRISAEQISQQADLFRLFQQRENFQRKNLQVLAQNYSKSVFYQSDLKLAAAQFVKYELPEPQSLDVSAPSLLRIQDQMFRAEVQRLRNGNGTLNEKKAFEELQLLLTRGLKNKVTPVRSVYTDQIVWSRSPVRLDIAGGWSDTPPYCIQNGGKVVNMAVDLNGQPPLQVFVRLSDKPKIVLRSIDNGVSEEITSWEELTNYNLVGSAFAIPRAALSLAGFHPAYCTNRYSSLADQLRDFGGGIEISLLAAVPKGSGLGTSSILAATLLGALSDFCGLGWDKQEICFRTLILEQLLTTGGGWQDQYGGVLGGIKLLESDPGGQEHLSVRWLPESLFTHADYRDNWLLYYTGITRVAKNILAEIVRGMFLNEGAKLQVIELIKKHAVDTYDVIQKNDYEATAAMIARSWELNKLLDSGTSTPEINTLMKRIEDLTIGMKLLGAGGGGYLLIAAKDASAAHRIKTELMNNPINSRARFVQMSLNSNGFQVTRS
jgi:galactokinase/mevalonate kinase-like predicted kinase